MGLRPAMAGENYLAQGLPRLGEVALQAAFCLAGGELGISLLVKVGAVGSGLGVARG